MCAASEETQLWGAHFVDFVSRSVRWSDVLVWLDCFGWALFAFLVCLAVRVGPVVCFAQWIPVANTVGSPPFSSWLLKGSIG